MSLRPSDLGLPFEGWRPFQLEAALQISRAFFGGAKFVALEAPPGAGKSGIVAAVAALCGEEGGEESTAILTSTHALQGQYAREFRFPVMMGRRNFKCVIAPTTAADAPCTEDEHCEMQGVNGHHGCPYYDHKRVALLASPYVTNYAYFLSEAAHVGDFRTPKLLICDEAHFLPNQLRGFAQLTKPKNAGEGVGEWKELLKAKIDMWARAHTVGFQPRSAKKALKDLRFDSRMLGLEETWVMAADGHTAQPIGLSNVAKTWLFRSPRILFVSATIGNPKVFGRQFGVDEVVGFSVPSVFDKSQRPIKFRNGGKLSAKNPDIEPMGHLIEKILADHEGERGLIHSVSYALAQRLSAVLSSPRLIFSNPRTLKEDVERYRKTEGAVLVSPAISTGIDLPYDQCRFQVIAKIPFPNQTDPVRKEQGKTKEGKELSMMDTANTLVQMYGRGMRAADDRCTTYLLDGNWMWFQHAAEEYLPKYFTEAFV